VSERPLRVEQVRRIAIAAQGLGTRFRRADEDEVARAVARLSCVQLDSIATVERSHRIVLSTRAGAHPADTLDRLLSHGKAFEYWAHEASILPVEEWPLFRRRMRPQHPWWGDVIAREKALARQVLREIEARGPLGSRHFEGAGGGGMWRLKPAKRMLDALWSAGRLVVAGRRGFQRLYDLPERVIPARWREAPVPSEAETTKRLALKAIRARGVLTERGVVEHWRTRGGVKAVQPAVRALEREGEILRLPVEDDGPDVLVPAGADLDPPAPRAAALLSPFDNLLWDRPFARRALGFDHLIEVYKKDHQRRYGYYVLPLVVGDRLVGRADLKADRAEGALLVKAFHREAGVRASSAVDDGLAKAAERLARSIDLAEVRGLS
jgi:uncharacterized protein YcaQ